MKAVYCLMAVFLLSIAAKAQDGKKEEVGIHTYKSNVDRDEDTTRRKNKSIAIGTDGVHIGDTGKFVEKPFEIEFTVVDVGINTLQDKTNYAGAAAQGFLNTPDGMKNDQLFSLRTGKSWNVNVWPVMFKVRLLKTSGQKLYVSSGVGLQMYNFRFNKDISYLNNTTPEVFKDSVQFSKNKLGITYLSIPLSLTAKTKIAKKTWLIYSAGLTGGYRISSLTKQESGARGKQKNHDAFNFNDFNACVTGEIGVSGLFRIYASYQLTALHETALDQHPFSIGLRFGGV
jgi:hypothetical protein